MAERGCRTQFASFLIRFILSSLISCMVGFLGRGRPEAKVHAFMSHGRLCFLGPQLSMTMIFGISVAKVPLEVMKVVMNGGQTRLVCLT